MAYKTQMKFNFRPRHMLAIKQKQSSFEM